MKRKKLKSLKYLKKKAWGLVREYVLKRDKNICFTCGKAGNQAGHFVHVNHLDYNLENIHCQCIYCNMYLHGNLGEYALRLGEQKATELLAQKHNTVRFTRTMIENIIIALQEKIKEPK